VIGNTQHQVAGKIVFVGDLLINALKRALSGCDTLDVVVRHLNVYFAKVISALEHHVKEGHFSIKVAAASGVPTLTHHKLLLC